MFQIISHLDDDAVLANTEHRGALLLEATGSVSLEVDGNLFLVTPSAAAAAPMSGLSVVIIKNNS